jgi:hypothetical protein
LLSIIDTLNLSEDERKFADVCKNVIFSQLSFFNDDELDKPKVDYKELETAINNQDSEAVDRLVGTALHVAFRKIEKVMEDLLSPKMHNSVGGSHTLALLSIVMTMAIKSQDLYSLRKDVGEAGAKVKNDASAYRSLIAGVFESIYTLSISKDVENVDRTTIN